MFDDTPDVDGIAALFEREAKVARGLFSTASKEIPSAGTIAEQAIAAALGSRVNDANFIKESFSELVAKIQVDAYLLYLDFERRACGFALGEFLERQAEHDRSIRDALTSRYFVFDRFFLSLTQSRRTRAGSTFEAVVSALFKKLSYPYSSQPYISGSKPDYVLPSLSHYERHATDCMIFTCKRTLRERWRQIVTEGMAGQAFFLATVDENLSSAELERMKARNVIVVVPREIKRDKYVDALNVASFEEFFEFYLDPAMNRWLAKGAISLK